MCAAERDEPASSSSGREPAAEPSATQGQRTQPINSLQAQVSSAVRGAIAGVMANQTPAVEMPELDLDFSLPPNPGAPQMPVLRAEPQRALASVELTPHAIREPNTGRWFILASASLATAGLALLLWFANQTKPEPAPDVEPKSQASIVVNVVPTIEPAIKAAKVPVPPPAPIAARDPLDIARDLVQAGHVTAGREELMKAGMPDRPDAALLLARSYDPNFLATLPSSDAKPDIEEDRRWYTHWYDIASKAGEVPSTMRLDLLLRSLNARAVAP